MRRAAAPLWACLLLGCAPARVPPPPAAPPALHDLTDAIPADLDIAVYVDVARLREALGAEWAGKLVASAAGGGASDAGTSKFVASALGRAERLVIAVRPGNDAEHSDAVLAMRGSFSGLDVRRSSAEPAWGAARDLGGDVRVWAREGARPRSAPVRVYAQGDELLVFVSSAEVDSVARAIEERAEDPRVEPPATGLVSVAARGRALSDARIPGMSAFARWLSRAEQLTARADVGAAGLDASVELSLSDEADARALSEAVGGAAKVFADGGGEGAAARTGRALKVEAVGGHVVLKLQLPPGDIAALWRCVSEATGC